MTADYSNADDILEGLDIEPNPRPKPGRPTEPPASSRVHGFLELAGVATISMALAVGLTAWWLGPRDHGPPAPPDAATLGRTFAPRLAEALATGFDADADALKAGKSFGEADKVLKQVFHDAHARAFAAHAGAALSTLIPDQDTIKDPAQRAALEAFHRDFARGLRSRR